MMRRMYDSFGDNFVANISPELESSVVVLNPPQNFRISADYIPGNQQEVLVRVTIMSLRTHGLAVTLKRQCTIQGTRPPGEFQDGYWVPAHPKNPIKVSCT
jgi:hypothetical protein